MQKTWKSIGLTDAEYQTLSDKKRQFENTVGQKFTWGNFLLVIIASKALTDNNHLTLVPSNKERKSYIQPPLINDPDQKAKKLF